jgi:hypothetical protein
MYDGEREGGLFLKRLRKKPRQRVVLQASKRSTLPRPRCVTRCQGYFSRLHTFDLAYTHMQLFLSGNLEIPLPALQ